MQTSYATPPARNRMMAGAYHTVGVQTSVISASPHQLIAMLFDGFSVAVNRARVAMQHGDMAVKAHNLTHAFRIIDEGLKAGLDLKAGGKLANDLSDLYAYVGLQLTRANASNDEALLDECLALIQPLREAWTEIGKE